MMHTLPTTNAGTVTYTGSGTDVRVFKGSSALTHTTGTPSTGQFKAVAQSATNIVAGSRSTVTKTTNDTARFANASGCSAGITAELSLV